MIGSIEAPFLARFEVSGNYLYSANEHGGVEKYDITNPADLQFVATTGWSVDSYIYDVKVKDSLLYYVSFYDGIKIIIADGPNEFTEVGSFDRENDTQIFIELYNDNAFITDQVDGVRGLTILDISDPSNPTFVSRIVMPLVREICFKGNFAFLAVDNVGVQVLDISDVRNPEIIATISTFCTFIEGMDIQGDRLYTVNYMATCYFDEMGIYDISNPEIPVPIAFHRGPSHPFDIKVDGKYIYIAGGNGVEVIEQSFDTECGDINGDYEVSTISDLTYLVSYLFSGGQSPMSDNSADLNGDGNIGISDLTYIVDYLFNSGPTPVCL